MKESERHNPEQGMFCHDLLERTGQITQAKEYALPAHRDSSNPVVLYQAVGVLLESLREVKFAEPDQLWNPSLPILRRALRAERALPGPTRATSCGAVDSSNVGFCFAWLDELREP